MELKIADIVELAKAGYRPKDVKELIEASKLDTKPEAVTEPTSEVITEQKESDITVKPEADKGAETAPKESAQQEPAVDYKAMYETEKQRVESLQNKLTRQDISKDPVEEVDLVSLVREFC